MKTPIIVIAIACAGAFALATPSEAQQLTRTPPVLTADGGGGSTGHGGDMVCQDRMEVIRNNLEERIDDGSAQNLNFAGTGTTYAEFKAKLKWLINLTRNHQGSLSCTDDQQEVTDIVDGEWEPVCGAKWLDDSSVPLAERTRPMIKCYRGNQQDGTGFLGMLGDKQYGQFVHELLTLVGLEDQSRQYFHYLLASQVSEKATQVTVSLWPAVRSYSTTEKIFSFPYRTKIKLLNLDDGPYYGGQSSTDGVCDADPAAGRGFASCFFERGDGVHYGNFVIAKLPILKGLPTVHLSGAGHWLAGPDEDKVAEFEYGSEPYFDQRIEILLKQTQVDLPFLVRLDLLTGKGSCGFSSTSLINFPG